MPDVIALGRQAYVAFVQDCRIAGLQDCRIAGLQAWQQDASSLDWSRVTTTQTQGPSAALQCCRQVKRHLFLSAHRGTESLRMNVEHCGPGQALVKKARTLLVSMRGVLWAAVMHLAVAALADADLSVIPNPTNPSLSGGEGRTLSAGESHELGVLLAEIDAVWPGFEDQVKDWIQDGGSIGVLTDGLAKERGYGGVTDGDTILINIGDCPTRAQIKARLVHEFYHTTHGAAGPHGGGGFLDACAHAAAFADTMLFSMINCDVDPVQCSTMLKQLSHYRHWAQQCQSPVSPPYTSPPACCI